MKPPYLRENPDAVQLPPTSEVFDYFKESSGEAVSEMVLDTRNPAYRADPERIFRQLKARIDAVADYDVPRTRLDIGPAQIGSRIIDVFVPAHTSSVQGVEIERAVLYGRGRGVTVVVSRVMG